MHSRFEEGLLSCAAFRFCLQSVQISVFVRGPCSVSRTLNSACIWSCVVSLTFFQQLAFLFGSLKKVWNFSSCSFRELQACSLEKQNNKMATLYLQTIYDFFGPSVNSELCGPWPHTWPSGAWHVVSTVRESNIASPPSDWTSTASPVVHACCKPRRLQRWWKPAACSTLYLFLSKSNRQQLITHKTQAYLERSNRRRIEYVRLSNSPVWESGQRGAWLHGIDLWAKCGMLLVQSDFRRKWWQSIVLFSSPTGLTPGFPSYMRVPM